METKTLGLITAPGVASRIAEGLKKELPDMLSYYVKEEYEWEVITFEDYLTGGTNDSVEVLERASNMRKAQGWDFAINLTDLPLLDDYKVVVAEVLKGEQVALVSLPGLGLAPMYKRIREAVLQLMNEIYYGSSDSDRQEAEARIQSKADGQYDELRGKKSTRLLGRRFFELIFPLKRETPENDEDINVRFIPRSRIGGNIRLLTGMVNANRPWELFPAFLKIIIVAFTTGAYALVFPTVWEISTNYSIGRAILMSVISILALISWIILSNKLWEKKGVQDFTSIRKLYNATTFFTLLITVIMYYVILFIMFSVIALLLIPPSQVATNISASAAHITDYLYAAWIATSISTIIGALGSAFEDEEVVLNSTYGYRQKQRHEEIRKLREQEENE